MAINIYEPGVIQPVVQIGENLGIWSDSKWLYFKTDYIEPVPRSSQSVVNFGALAAAATIGKALVQILRLESLQLLHLRFEPLDDVELVLWEKGGAQRFINRSFTARISLLTCLRDPYLATTTFFVLGRDKDPFIEVFNPSITYARAQSRAIFWGYRYILQELKTEPAVYTRIPAEGRAS